MAISNDQVEQIQTQTIDLGDLILSMKPVTEREWNAFEKLVAAHKSLTSIDADSLRQLHLPLQKEGGYDPHA